MTSEITKEQMCIFMRSGVEIWLDKEKAEKLMADMENGRIEKFFRVEGRLVNVVEMVGILTPADVRDIQQVRRGMWKCKYNIWHSKNDHCECGRR